MFPQNQTAKGWPWYVHMYISYVHTMTMICTPIIGLLRIKSDFATLKSSDGLATLYKISDYTCFDCWNKQGGLVSEVLWQCWVEKCKSQSFCENLCGIVWSLGCKSLQEHWKNFLLQDEGSNFCGSIPSPCYCSSAERPCHSAESSWGGLQLNADSPYVYGFE